jgi:uncharacterized protein YgbK (DUF1537 family)
MIAVIADDLAGASELACAAAAMGFTAEVHTRFDPRSTAEVIAIDTDTRLSPAAPSRPLVTRVTKAVLSANPEWIYKKTDSVLRGNVRSEIEAILDETRQPRSILIPANPSKNRIIRDGIYHVDGTPLAQTLFSRDPHHPRSSSRVNELLGPAPSQDRLVVPDVCSAEDLARYAAEVDAQTLPAGGVDFFQALLRARRPEHVVQTLESSPRTLYICGSAAAWDAGRAEQFTIQRIPVVAMPDTLFAGTRDPAALAAWSANVISTLESSRRAVLTIGRSSKSPSPLTSEELLDLLIETALTTMGQARIDRICLEGGATAAELLKRLGWTRLIASGGGASGVATLHPPSGPALLIKPGSYPWPSAVLQGS